MNKTIEVLKSTILLEKRGHAFYTHVAKSASDPGVKQIFEAMAKEEELHIDQLSKQYVNFNEKKEFLNLSVGKPEIANKVLSGQVREQISAVSYEAAAISAAMAMEEQSVETYSSRAKNAKDSNEKKFYRWLADWEVTHLDYLVELNRQLTEKVWYDNHFWPF